MQKNAPYEPGQTLTLTFESLALGGDAVGRSGGFVFFVPFAAPGDTAEIQLTEVRKNYGRGRLINIVTPSPSRVAPPCPYYLRCGGCHYQHLDYPAQTAAKKKHVEDSLSRITRLSEITAADTIAMANPWHYRTKTQAVTGRRQGEKKIGTAGFAAKHNSGPAMGFYERQSHNFIAISGCMIQKPLNNNILKAVEALLPHYRWSVYNEKKHEGALRHCIVRSNKAETEAIVTLVSRERELPSLEHFAESLTREIGEIRGIILSHNPKRTNVILGEECHTVWGRDYIHEETSDIMYRISPLSFFQVNPEGLEAMLEVISEYAGADKEASVLDAYCGVGVFSLYLAGKVRHVLGVDEVKRAVQDARMNARLNNIENARFLESRSSEALLQFRQEGRHFDCVILDPPRKGAEVEVLESLLAMEVPRLVYVSCNPATLARDLEVLAAQYRIRAVQPVDMFPQTCQVETIVSLEHKGGN
ncbi:MAG: 23S rRNA (uracil(1939)-C(5))-methyltransferase RlmD [Candidatus Xenobiia bacterium LiM19]